MSPHDPSDPPSQPGSETRELLAGALGEQYLVRRLLGRGGFAEVYDVEDTSLERRLAVKVLRPDVAWTAGMLARFRQEARAVARLTHPNILPIHFVGEGGGLVYYAMPLVDGRSLGERLREEGALEVDRALGIIRPILEALQHAHDHGFLHRDIKPDNVMIEDRTGRVLLMDFGIAKRVDAGAGLTQTGFVVGTPYYMSPEQALGQTDLDARSDLYSIGAMLFQMITGAPPFDGDTSQEIVAKHISEPPPVPVARNAETPRWLSDIVLRCLAKRPADRPRSAGAVLSAIAVGPQAGPREAVSVEPVARRLQGQETTPLATPAAGPAPSGGNAARPVGRIVALAALVVLGGAAAWFFVLRPPSLLVVNRLTAPIRVTVAGREHDIAHGAELRMRLRRGEALLARWSIVRPTTPSGVAMGVEVEGVFLDERPSGEVRRVADATVGGRAYFAPLVTNATGEPLTVTVNPGLVGVVSCGCRIPPGMTRAMVGYYPLFSNSAVEVRDGRGRAAVFRDVASNVDVASGSIGIRFEDKDLR